MGDPVGRAKEIGGTGDADRKRRRAEAIDQYIKYPESRLSRLRLRLRAEERRLVALLCF